MAIISLELPPELEQQLLQASAQQGIEPNRYIVETLLERLQPQPPTEAELLEQINISLSEEEWQQYHQLIAKRQAEILTETEHSHLIKISNQLEAANAKRIKALGLLSKRWNMSLEATMEKLGIQSPGYV